MPSREILPEEAAKRYAQGRAFIVDVRTLREWRAVRIPNSIHLPLDEISARYQELDEDAELLLICAHGIRSAAATRWLEEAGFTRVANIRHGLCQWPGLLEHG